MGGVKQNLTPSGCLKENPGEIDTLLSAHKPPIIIGQGEETQHLRDDIAQHDTPTFWSNIQ